MHEMPGVMYESVLTRRWFYPLFWVSQQRKKMSELDCWGLVSQLWGRPIA